jgi:hypothetical protein
MRASVVADKMEGDAMKNDDDALCNGDRSHQQYVEPESPKRERQLDTAPIDWSAVIRDKSMTDEEHERRRQIIQEARAIAASEWYPISPLERLEIRERQREAKPDLVYKTYETPQTEPQETSRHRGKTGSSGASRRSASTSSRCLAKSSAKASGGNVDKLSEN